MIKTFVYLLLFCFFKLNLLFLTSIFNKSYIFTKL